MISARLKQIVSRLAVAAVSASFVFGSAAWAECPREKIAEYVAELTEMSTKAENSVRYLIPRFRECGQGAIAGELDGTPEWLAAMRQHLQAQANNPAEMKVTIETGLANLNKAEASLQKNYDLVLKGIDSMYDNRFPPKCRRERTEIVTHMKSTRPLVPIGIGKLTSLRTCMGVF
jgi:hypothetical protein